MACECRINYREEIEYCPLHAAAPVMLEALETVINCVDLSDNPSTLLVVGGAIARSRTPVTFVGGNCHECSDDATVVVGDRHYCDDHAAIALARSGSPAPVAPVIDVCLAGNPAVNGVCGDPDCVCSTEPLEDDKRTALYYRTHRP